MSAAQVWPGHLSHRCRAERLFQVNPLKHILHRHSPQLPFKHLPRLGDWHWWHLPVRVQLHKMQARGLSRGEDAVSLFMHCMQQVCKSMIRVVLTQSHACHTTLQSIPDRADEPSSCRSALAQTLPLLQRIGQAASKA